MAEFAREREEESRYVVNVALVAFLTSLRPAYRLATLSNDWPGGRAYNERHYALSQVLGASAMLYSYEEGLVKLDPAFYLLACDRLGVAANEAVFVDNLEECVAGARDAELEAVLYSSAAQTIADLRRMLAGL